MRLKGLKESPAIWCGASLAQLHYLMLMRGTKEPDEARPRQRLSRK